MLSEEIKEKLLPHIQEIVPEENWGDIPSFFSEVYLIDYEDGVKAFVFGYWDDPNPVICFDAETFEFLGVAMQDWTREHGVLV